MGLLVAVLAAGLLVTPGVAAERGGFTIAPAGALDGAVITLDPGHNGANGANPNEINQQVPIGNGATKECDTAGTETGSGYTESAYTLSVAKRRSALATWSPQRFIPAGPERAEAGSYPTPRPARAGAGSSGSPLPGGEALDAPRA